MSPRGNLTEYLLQCLNTVCGRRRRAGDAIPNPGVLLPRTVARAQPAEPQPAWGFGEKLRVRDFSDTAAGLPVSALADETLLEGEGRVRALFSIGGIGRRREIRRKAYPSPEASAFWVMSSKRSDIPVNIRRAPSA